MNWHSEHGANGNKRRANTTTKVDSTLAKKLLSTGCTLQEIELYQKTCGEKINACVKDEILKQGADKPSDRMRIRREIVNKLWEEDKNKPDVRKMVDAEKVHLVEAKKAEENKNEEQTPEQYQK